MKWSVLRGVVPAFLLAVVLATVWGSVVQTQYNLAALASIGADVGPVRWQATAGDLFSGFFPTYGGYVVLPALLVAFGIAWWLAPRLPRSPIPLRIPLFALAGVLGLALGIVVVNLLAPVALLIGATRDWSCIAWMALAGLPAGVLFAALVHSRPPRALLPPPAGQATHH